MGLSINTNIPSIRSGNEINQIHNNLNSNMAKLSSALRINSAKDDAAGLAIATRMTSEERSLMTAVRNANDGMSITQTAEGAMNEMTNNLQRIRELSIAARSGQYSESDINNMQQEVDALVGEINRISEQTTFNNRQLLNGSFSASISLSDDPGEGGIDINVDNLGVGSLGADGGRTLDTIMSSEGAQSIGLSTGGGETLTSNPAGAVEIVDSALNQIMSTKSSLGAITNRFEAAARNIDNNLVSTTASKSRIMDADMATETANNTKNLILQQAAVSVHAQAGRLPQNILSLLQ